MSEEGAFNLNLEEKDSRVYCIELVNHTQAVVVHYLIS